ncbi:DUF4259 domain-containing protein [Streptomyces goshikiensis]|uniref:DUF4259 domain-containing protein n=1 Tax=Streptomyces goshikiensis TaxID=1942 RepID=UPI003656E213
MQALDRVVTDPSELMELWGETSKDGSWRASLVQIRTALLTASSGGTAAPLAPS